MDVCLCGTNCIGAIIQLLNHTKLKYRTHDYVSSAIPTTDSRTLPTNPLLGLLLDGRTVVTFTCAFVGSEAKSL